MNNIKTGRQTDRQTDRPRNTQKGSNCFALGVLEESLNKWTVWVDEWYIKCFKMMLYCSSTQVQSHIRRKWKQVTFCWHIKPLTSGQLHRRTYIYINAGNERPLERTDGIKSHQNKQVAMFVW